MHDPAHREALVFNQALELPASERDGYLRESCRDDAELHSRVVALLEAHERAGAFLEEPQDRSGALPRLVQENQTATEPS